MEQEMVKKLKAVCPECKAEIDDLFCREYPTVEHRFDPTKMEYEKVNETDACIDEYSCPNCGEQIAESENEAVALFHQ